MKDRFAFLSYSREDSEIVEDIVDYLEEHGMNIYLDRRNIPPGASFSEIIVEAIENSVCCVLVLSDASNKSPYVCREMNCALTYNKYIFPIRTGNVKPSRSLEFYIGVNNWTDYNGTDSLDRIIAEYMRIFGKTDEPTKIAHTCKITSPVVMRSEQLYQIGYTVKQKIIETIEIDYQTLGNSPVEYEIDESKEGTLDDWLEYANCYPETSSMLIANDHIVGYYQFELLNEENYDIVVAGKQMITSEMEELYGFGGEFCCYIAIMPILKEYETQKNYISLVDDFFRKMVEFFNDGIMISKFAISVYAPMLNKVMSALGFKEVGKNPAGGTIMELTQTSIINNAILQKKYPDFYHIYGGINADA